MIEYNKLIVQEWGEQFTAETWYAAGMCCPHCDEFGRLALIKGNREQRWFDAMVGFSRKKPIPNDAAAGSVILRCPLCQGKFFHHLLYTHVDIYIRRVPLWPK